MKWTEDKLDILQNLEFSVVNVWDSHPEMTDYSALRAYEAAFRHYRAESRGQTPKPHDLTGVDAQVYDAVKAMCDFRLGRGKPPIPTEAPDNIPPVSLDKILECLRELAKSVERHTKLGGRQGYLTFVEQYLP